MTRVLITPNGELVCARRILWCESEELDTIENAKISIGYEEEPMWLMFVDDNQGCYLVSRSAIDRCIDVGEL